MNKQVWDDIRYVLAVARCGSLNAAASALGVTHATVMRRVAAFEAAHGRALFDKDKSGYRLLDEARPILEEAASVEDAVLKLGRAISGMDTAPTGRVRIASTDSLCLNILPAAIMALEQRFPKIELTLLSGNSHHDLTRLSADIVVRPTVQLGDDLVGEVVGHLEFATYATTPDATRWLGLRGSLRRSKPARWMAENLPPEAGRTGADSFLALTRLAALGHGKALLPTFLGDPEPALVRIPSEAPDMAVPIWVAMLEDLAETPRFLLVRKALAAHLKAALPSTLAQSTKEKPGRRARITT